MAKRKNKFGPNHPHTVARILNAHHYAKQHGFYPSTGGRAFRARWRGAGNPLEVSYDFETFKPVAPGTTFSDAYGREVARLGSESES